MKRRKMNRQKSRKVFSRSASRTHRRNLVAAQGSAGIMRGGYRL